MGSQENVKPSGMLDGFVERFLGLVNPECYLRTSAREPSLSKRLTVV